MELYPIQTPFLTNCKFANVEDYYCWKFAHVVFLLALCTSHHNIIQGLLYADYRCSLDKINVRIGPISQHFKTRKEISSKSNCIRSPSAPPSLSCLIIAKEKSRSGCQKTFDISHRAPVLSSPHKLQTRNCILGPVETGGVQVSQYLVKLGSLPKLQQSKKNLRKIDGQNSLGLHFPPCWYLQLSSNSIRMNNWV